MTYIKTSRVKSVASCASGTAVTIAMDEDESIVIIGSVTEIRALAQQIIDTSAKSADPLHGLTLMEVGPR